MRVAIFTLTRDRLFYTRQAFAALKENAGIEFDHFVVDNGSQDGTAEFLKNEYNPRWVYYSPYNVGISRGSNIALDAIFRDQYDVIVKYDNDAALKTPGALNIIGNLVLKQKAILSPAVIGINRQPSRGWFSVIDGYQIGNTGIVGGLCHVTSATLYKAYRYPETLQLARGQDDDVCHWVKKQGGVVGYVESVLVEHIEGTDSQAKRFKEYFERKWNVDEKLTLADVEKERQRNGQIVI